MLDYSQEYCAALEALGKGQVARRTCWKKGKRIRTRGRILAQAKQDLQMLGKTS